MLPHLTLFLVALLIAANIAAAATHRTLNLLRGSEVANVIEWGLVGYGL